MIEMGEGAGDELGIMIVGCFLLVMFERYCL